MQKNNLLIILGACLVTAIAVGYEVYLWQQELNLDPTTPTAVTGSFDEIKTKEQGIAACETNRAYGKAYQNTEDGKTATALVTYCYSVIAGKFNDLSLCQRTTAPADCEEAAKNIIQMGKEIQNLSPEEREQIKKYAPSLIK